METAAAIDVVDSHLSAARETQGIPGVAYGLLRDGELVHVGSVGESAVGSGALPDGNTVFRIASMTKSFTAAAVLLLRDRGLLRLDDPLVDHCPWTAGIGAPEGSHPISVRDLLSMQAGFPTDDPWGDRQESLAIADFDALVSAGLSFTRPPRTRFEYSNLGYALLGRVITQVTGEEYTSFMRREILEPLGMASTWFDVGEVPAERLAAGYAPVEAGLTPEPVVGPGAFSPMGGLLTCVHDLSLWVRGLSSALGPQPTDHPLAAVSRSEMQQPQRLIDTLVTRPSPDDGSESAQVVTVSYGYGVMVEDDHALGRTVSHGGGYPGFGSHMRWHGASGWAVVAMGNRTYANVRAACTAAMAEILAATPSATEPDLWPETRDAMGMAEVLLRDWDDALLDRHAAVNVDLDRPRAERRAEWARVGAGLGPLSRTADPVESDSPAHARWWVEGPGGRVRLEVRLSPERPPLVQTLTVSEGTE